MYYSYSFNAGNLVENQHIHVPISNLLFYYFKSVFRGGFKGGAPAALKILYTLAGGPLNFEALGFSLSSLQVNPALYVL